jgi:NADPH-dependent 2,4-dienoyl-CoA reductase/sulfur reductase-like enzyme
VGVQTATSLQAVQRDGADLLVHSDRGVIRAQIVIVAVGVRPDVALAREAGIALGASGAIAVDSAMRTSAPAVFAAGDCAEAHHLVLDRPTWVPLGTTANKQGKVAGANAAGGDEHFGGIVGSAGFKCFDLEVARTGLGAADIASANLDAVAAASTHHTRARSYPGDKPITTVVYAERGSGRLLGAQMIGGEAVAKRIDVFATALHARMTLAQVEALDLTYAPPFAPVYDAILIAATVGVKALAKGAWAIIKIPVFMWMLSAPKHSPRQNGYRPTHSAWHRRPRRLERPPPRSNPPTSMHPPSNLYPIAGQIPQ